MLGSPSIKEGVSLLRTEQVHILEPYWNISRMLQIIGRAIRFVHIKMLKEIGDMLMYFYIFQLIPMNIQ